VSGVSELKLPHRDMWPLWKRKSAASGIRQLYTVRANAGIRPSSGTKGTLPPPTSPILLRRDKLVIMRMSFAVILVALDLCGRAQSLQAVQDNLKPPPNEALVLEAHAAGDQIYVCDGSTWAFSRPDARLFDESRKQIGLHFAGPTWQFNDGSRVTGRPVANATADPGSIPWLLLKATDHQGGGVMKQVTSIQRLSTKGGRAPESGCDPQHKGHEARSGYRAVYLFYAGSNTGTTDQVGKVDGPKSGLELEDRSSHPVREFVYSILLNIAAAIIFWLFFAYFPERHRRTKLRPKVELGIYQVYRTLFATFDSIMRSEARSPSSFQKKINGNALRPEDIELGLENKCLNETFLYDEKVSRSLIPIGKELFEMERVIDEATERLFAFSSYLTTREILILEQIRGTLQVYTLKHYDRPAGARIGDTRYMPVNPSLAYMKDNLAHLYELFDQLRDIVFNNRYRDRDVLFSKIQCDYEQGKYRRCEHSIRTARAVYTKDRTWLELHQFLCEYMGGNKAAACDKLDDILKARPELVSNRGFLLDVISDSSVRQIIEKYYTNVEIEAFDLVVGEELAAYAGFIELANRLKAYYQLKLNSTLSKKSG
jgi:hypothetical protein